jgi:excinuclease UvrABC ATPase subunit
MARKVLLEHLILGQQTSTLSGGENIRAKLFHVNHLKADVIGIDEPFRGLGKHQITEICSFLDDLCVQGKTIIVVDHEEVAFDYFDFHMELINDKGKLITKKGD